MQTAFPAIALFFCLFYIDIYFPEESLKENKFIDFIPLLHQSINNHLVS